MVIKTLECINMLVIAYQDFRYRAIHWLLFLTLALLFFIDGASSQSLKTYELGVVLNIAIIFLQFSVLVLFYLFKGKKLNDIVNKTIGSGDIVFIFILAFAFPWQCFLFYYISAMLFSILAWLPVGRFFSSKENLIPFAGLMSLFCFLLIGCELIVPGYDRFNVYIFRFLLNG
jgi:hypothetical protein